MQVKPHSERPVEETTPEMIDNIHNMVLTDWRIKVREIFQATGILQGTAFSILHEKLVMKKSWQDECQVSFQRTTNATVWSPA